MANKINGQSDYPFSSPLWRYIEKYPDHNIGDMAQHIEKLEQLICKAAPLAWSTGNYMEDAAQWEKDAKELLEKKR